MIACIDSDVLIDFFDGIEAAALELNLYTRIVISRINWMEVLIGVADPQLRELRENFLTNFEIVELDLKIARDAVHLRNTYRLKLPDAIVWATARSRGAILVSRNGKDFPAKDPGVRFPYKI